LILEWSFAVPGVVIGLVFMVYAVRYYLYSFVALRDKRSTGPQKEDCGGEDRGLVSILLPVYNEANVVDRLLEACTSLDYPEYEIVIVDDSTDEESLRKVRRWEGHPKVRVVRRSRREGFKSGALNEGLRHLHPESKFVLFLDADFIPPPEILQRSLHLFEDGDIAAVQGYQDHALNWDENLVTRMVRVSATSGYMVDFYARSRLGTLLQLTGSAMIIRTEIAKKMRFCNPCQTEDWDLTLRLYLEGHRIVFDPTLRVPAECPSTLTELIRQQMRWAEGHTRVAKRYFRKMLSSPLISLRRKMEFLLLAGFYFQALLFLVGVACAAAAELLQVRIIPTEVGFLIFLFDALAPISLGSAGLYLEGDLRSNSLGLLSSPLMVFALAPFLSLAFLRGLVLSDDHGSSHHWHRTHKTGKITPRAFR